MTYCAIIILQLAVRVTAAVAKGATFTLVAANSTCSASSVPVTARSDIECAMKCSQEDSSLSFSFVNGVCVLSDRADCAESGAATVFQKQADSASSSGLRLSMPVVSPGYRQQIGDRTFWVFQQRQTGQVAFNRSWNDYVVGFGNAAEFWIGLENISSFTAVRNSNLRVEVLTLVDEFYEFEWLSFSVGNSVGSYSLSLGSFLSANSTISCDLLYTARNQSFSTFDRDNDIYIASCSIMYGSGGYWWKSCMNSNPNGLYSANPVTNSTVKPKYMSTLCIGVYKTLRAMRMMLQV